MPQVTPPPPMTKQRTQYTTQMLHKQCDVNHEMSKGCMFSATRPFLKRCMCSTGPQEWVLQLQSGLQA